MYNLKNSRKFKIGVKWMARVYFTQLKSYNVIESYNLYRILLVLYYNLILTLSTFCKAYSDNIVGYH